LEMPKKRRFRLSSADHALVMYEDRSMKTVPAVERENNTRDVEIPKRNEAGSPVAIVALASHVTKQCAIVHEGPLVCHCSHNHPVGCSTTSVFLCIPKA